MYICVLLRLDAMARAGDVNAAEQWLQKMLQVVRRSAHWAWVSYDNVVGIQQLGSWFQLIALREKLQETPICHGKIFGFL